MTQLYTDPSGRASTDRHAIEGPCPNCGDPTQSNYCPSCGQRRTERRVSLRRMLAEVLEDQLSVNAALPRTLKALLFQPGRLSREYLAGRIQRYIPPFRLYLGASVVFFLLLSISMRDIPLNVSDELAADSAGRAPGQDSSRGLNVRVSGVQRDTTRTAADSTGPYLWGDGLDLGMPVPALDTLLAHRLDVLRRMPPEQALRIFMGEVVSNAPTAVFLLLPVFALLLKLLYIRRKRYYVEHFVFGLHTHAFMFLMFSAMLVGDVPWVQLPAMLWMLVYFFLAMKRFYQQGVIRTFLKYVILGQVYMIVVSFGVALLLVGALLLA